ncbi:hypothetical protein AAF712_005240 [Marasmius tenuissimus]|uniref:J domain-containing protein n=1 Tax=Marasmius tenuissimus TaxID=585030 RepID=A0ABR3A1H9_9AGAR
MSEGAYHPNNTYFVNSPLERTPSTTTVTSLSESFTEAQRSQSMSSVSLDREITELTRETTPSLNTFASFNSGAILNQVQGEPAASENTTIYASSTKLFFDRLPTVVQPAPAECHHVEGPFDLRGLVDFTELDAKAYPACRFWQPQNYRASEMPTEIDGKKIEYAAYQFLESQLGEFLHPERCGAILRDCRGVWFMFGSAGMITSGSWDQLMPLVRVGYYRIMRVLAPELQLCEGNWKADRVAKEGFSSWWQNHGKKLLKAHLAKKEAEKTQVNGGASDTSGTSSGSLTVVSRSTPALPPTPISRSTPVPPSTPTPTPMGVLVSTTPASNPIPVTPASTIPEALPSPVSPTTPTPLAPAPTPATIPHPPAPLSTIHVPPPPAAAASESTTIAPLVTPPNPPTLVTPIPVPLSSVGQTTPPSTPIQAPLVQGTPGNGKRPRSESMSQDIDEMRDIYHNPSSMASSRPDSVEENDSGGSGQDDAPLPKRARLVDAPARRKNRKAINLFPSSNQRTGAEKSLPCNNDSVDSMVVDDPTASASELQDQPMGNTDINETCPSENNQASMSISNGTPAILAAATEHPPSTSSGATLSNAESEPPKPKLSRGIPTLRNPQAFLKYGVAGTSHNLAKCHYRDMRKDLHPDKIPQGEFWTWLDGAPDELWEKFYYAGKANGKANSKNGRR